MPSVWINGRYEDEETASISLRDTGLLHAAGVFTTMRSYNGKVFRLAGHLERLRDSCQTFSIPLSYTDGDLTDAIGELLRRNELPDARLRLTITRGKAEVDPVHGMHLAPTVFLTATAAHPYPAEFYEKGMTVIVVDEQKLNPYDVQAGHKTLNYLSRLHALRSANLRGTGEAMLFNVHNYLQSGSISNVYIVKNGTITTPPTPKELYDPLVRDATPYPKSAVLPGITRQTILDLAKQQNIPLKLAGIDINQLLEADEVFISNSVMNVMPVCRIERKAIGSDKPGPITTKLADLLRQTIERETSAT